MGVGMGMTEGTLPPPPYFLLSPPPGFELAPGNCKEDRFEAMGCQADILAPTGGRWGIGKVLPSTHIKPQLQLFTQEYQIESAIID